MINIGRVIMGDMKFLMIELSESSIWQRSVADKSICRKYVDDGGWEVYMDEEEV